MTNVNHTGGLCEMESQALLYCLQLEMQPPFIINFFIDNDIHLLNESSYAVGYLLMNRLPEFQIHRAPL